MNSLILAVIAVILGTLALLFINDFNFEYLLHSIKSIEPLNWASINTALFCGSLIGWERKLRKKVLGLRTSIFIILGTYIFTAISVHVALNNSASDSTRVIGQIVSGIGFLGAGVIFTKGNKVSGLTSASSIWMLAALGICIGIGYLSTAIIISTLGVTLLLIINEIDDYLVNISKNIRVFNINKDLKLRETTKYDEEDLT